MNASLKDIAYSCLHGAENNSLHFPQIVQILIQHNFEGYLIDYRRNTACYYHSNGDCIEVAFTAHGGTVAMEFNAATIKSAIQEAQQGKEGYTYKGFSRKVMEGGCAGYVVSLTGRRVLYFGRNGDAHIEHFPQ